MKTLLKTWMETIFPPLCVCCKRVSDRKLFCGDCWALLSPLDPIDRCPHCFEPSEGMCRFCKHHPFLSYPRASVFEPSLPASYLVQKRKELLPAFMILQWVQLDWPIPDVVVPMPGSKDLAFKFAEMIERPFAPILREDVCDVEAIEPDQVIFLIDNEEKIQKVRLALSLLEETFPKKGFVLSLFPYDLSDS